MVSVDAAGNPQRYGTIRAFDFSDPAAPVEVGRRVLNLSPQAISEQIFLQGIPTEGGVPLAIALIGTDAAYVVLRLLASMRWRRAGESTPPHAA